MRDILKLEAFGKKTSCICLQFMVYVLRGRGLNGEIGFCATVVFQRGSGSFSCYVFLAYVSCGCADLYNACPVYYLVLVAETLR